MGRWWGGRDDIYSIRRARVGKGSRARRCCDKMTKAKLYEKSWTTENFMERPTMSASIPPPFLASVTCGGGQNVNKFTKKIVPASILHTFFWSLTNTSGRCLHPRSILTCHEMTLNHCQRPFSS
jgi:hypothetical protein